MFRRAVLTLLISLPIGLAACSDSTNPDANRGTVAGTVSRLDGGDLPADVLVIAMTDTYEVLRVVRLEADGAFAFERLPAQSLLLQILHPHYVLAEPFRARIVVPDGGTLAHAMKLVRNFNQAYDYRITGHVTNAVSGAPVVGAWIAPIGLGEAGNSIRYLVNNSSTAVTVTDEKGFYSLARHGVSEGDPSAVIGLDPFSCAREGYLSRTFAGEGPDYGPDYWTPGGLLPVPPDSNLVVDIELVPVPLEGPATTGTVRGVVVHDGEPRAGVQVAMTLISLAERDTVFDPADKVVVHDGTTVSSADGSFVFEMPPGFYALRAGLPPDDGWCRDTGVPDLEVVTGVVLDVGEVSVGRAIRPLTPGVGEVVAGERPTLSWTSFPGADYYLVGVGYESYREELLGTTSDTLLVWPGDLPATGESWLLRWDVFAVREPEPDFRVTLSWFELAATFTLSGPAE